MDRVCRSVRQVLGGNHEVFVISPDATVFEAIERLAEKNVGALMVMEGDRLVGVVSERDYVRKVELLGKTASKTTVRQIMSQPAVFVTPEHRIDQCLALMKDHQIRHLPVVERNKVIGVISVRDVLEELISEDEHLISDLGRERLPLLHPDPSSY